MKKLFHSTCLIFLVFLLSCSGSKTEKDTYLVILSMDGFRWDYPNMTATPNLDSIARVGVKVEAIRSVFPSKTFPNHYTMATGLYPDHHGIVNNHFYDPDSDMTYSMRDSSSRLNPYFYGGEPIWVTAEKQNVRTASYFWVGSELPIQGIQPSIWKYYEHRLPFEQRIDSVIAWLQLPEKNRPRLIMWYMHEPDAIGHRFGPESPETLQKVTYLDSLVGVFCRKIRSLEHADRINLIFTSDHGMGAISPDRTVTLTDHVPADWVGKALGGNPVYNIKAKEGYIDSVYLKLKSLDHIQVWKHGEVPVELNYGQNPRTLDIIVAADSAWSINWNPAPDYYNSGGTHGYDIRQLDMQAIFYASGPAFRKNHTHPKFDNVDLYPLIAHILGIVPVEVDGKLERVEGMLR